MTVALGLVALACGDISSPPTSLGGRAGTGGTGGRGGSAGQGGSGGSAGQGGSAQAQGGAAGSDGAPDASAGGQGGSGGSAPVVPAGCPTPNPIPAIPEQVIAIQSIRFGESPVCTGNSCPEIVLRNVSDSTLTIPGGEQGWFWCNVPGYWYVSAADVTLEPGETFAFVPQYRTEIRPLYNGDDSFDTNEMGIYISTGVFDEPDKLRAFVVWGEGSMLDSRESIGSMSFLWTYGDRITIDPGDEGFVATGRTDLGSGYTSVPRRCLLSQ